MGVGQDSSAGRVMGDLRINRQNQAFSRSLLNTHCLCTSDGSAVAVFTCKDAMRKT